MTTIVELDSPDTRTVEQLAQITFDAFRESSPQWLPTMETARRQVLAVVETNQIGKVLVDQDRTPMGWIGLIPGARVWEIHPIAIAVEHQYKGYGQLLVEDAAAMATNAGALTLFASTSDEVGTTNLFGQNLYDNPALALANLQATGRTPYKFWESAGFTVVGVLPDAEGKGKPSIHLARELTEREK